MSDAMRPNEEKNDLLTRDMEDAFGKSVPLTKRMRRLLCSGEDQYVAKGLELVEAALKEAGAELDQPQKNALKQILQDNLRENKPRFEELIDFDTPMTPQQAAEVLAEFHGSPTDKIKDAFINLRNFNEGTVTFKWGPQAGKKFVEMEGRTPENYVWSHYIDGDTGRKIDLLKNFKS